MEFYFNNNKMEYNNDFSSLDNQLMVNIPEENNYNDIQNLNNFPRDSFVDHTNDNNTNNINQKAPFQHQHFPVNDDSSSDEYESGYSESFKKTMSFYQQEQDENLNQLNQNKNINKNISNINNINIIIIIKITVIIITTILLQIQIKIIIIKIIKISHLHGPYLKIVKF